MSFKSRIWQFVFVSVLFQGCSRYDFSAKSEDIWRHPNSKFGHGLILLEGIVVGLSRRIVIIMSGGLDSVCFAATLSSDSDLYAITFKYGQRAQREVAVARHFAHLLNVEQHRIVDIQFMKALYGASNALTDSR